MTHVIGVVGKSLMSRGVHGIDLVMSRPKVFFHIMAKLSKISNFWLKSDDFFQKIIGTCNKIFPFGFFLAKMQNLPQNKF
jgi:hypothetical protein